MLAFGAVSFNLFAVEIKLGELSSRASLRTEEVLRRAPPPIATAPTSSGPATRRIIKHGFDGEYYLRAYSDVATAKVDPLWHYENFGRAELRNPNAYFDSAGYLANYPDVAAAKVDPFDHYMTIGWREGRDPSQLFTTSAYLANYPDVAAAGLNPLEHFLNNGIYEGRSPTASAA